MIIILLPIIIHFLFFLKRNSLDALSHSLVHPFSTTLTLSPFQYVCIIFGSCLIGVNKTRMHVETDRSIIPLKARGVTRIEPRQAYAYASPFNYILYNNVVLDLMYTRDFAGRQSCPGANGGSRRCFAQINNDPTRFIPPSSNENIRSARARRDPLTFRSIMELSLSSTRYFARTFVKCVKYLVVTVFNITQTL